MLLTSSLNRKKISIFFALVIFLFFLTIKEAFAACPPRTYSRCTPTNSSVVSCTGRRWDCGSLGYLPKSIPPYGSCNPECINGYSRTACSGSNCEHRIEGCKECSNYIHCYKLKPRTCNCGSWSNLSCGGGGCAAYQRQQVQYCNWSDGSGRCATNYRCVSDSSCRSCDCGSWSNLSCGGGGCAVTQRQQVQYCNWNDGSGRCDTNYRCRDDSSCCSCSRVNGACNSAGSCAMIGEDLLEGQRRWNLSCTPAGCSSGTGCSPDSSCNCDCTWVNQGCGLNGCELNEMSQIATNCNFPDDCNNKTRCVKIPECASSCEITLPSSPFSVGIDKSKILNSEVNPTNAYVDRVNFSLIENDPAGAVAINPTLIETDSAPNTPTNYNTVVQGNIIGGATLRADVTLLPEGTCSNTVEILVQSTPWIQTQGGDIYSGGSLSNEIPEEAENRNFSLKLDDWPGVIIHGEGEASFGEYGYSSNDSPLNWVANSVYLGKPFGTFQFFRKKFALQMQEPNFISGEAPEENDVYYAQGPVVLSGESWQNLGDDRWIVLLVDDEDGGVTINSDIVIPPGSFLAIATNGDINFNGEVSQAQGMFVADGIIDTGVNPQASLKFKNFWGKILKKVDDLLARFFRLEILAAKPPSGDDSELPDEALFAGEGVFVASEFVFSRDFGDERNDQIPSETFKARPDFIMSSYNGPDQNLWWFFQQWQEIAP